MYLSNNHHTYQHYEFPQRKTPEFMMEFPQTLKKQETSKTLLQDCFDIESDKPEDNLTRNQDIIRNSLNLKRSKEKPELTFPKKFIITPE